MKKIPVVSKTVVFPFILVTSLFALWGFANDITNPMVSAFKKVLELDNFQASLVQLAFYGGYFTMAIPAALFVNRYSYKKGVLLGLLLYATGAMLFYPAAAYQEYYFFLAALYILTFGLAFLETTANPYILAMGDETTATARLNLAQAFNPMGALAGLMVAQNYILAALQSDDVTNDGVLVYETLNENAKAVVRASDLAVIRDPYVLLGIGVLGFFFLMLFTKMPQNKVQEAKVDFIASTKRLFQKKHFVWGVVAQIFYVGAQIMVWTYLYQYAESIGIDNRTAVNYGISALCLFLAGRWIGTALMKFFNSGMVLFCFGIGASVCTLMTMFAIGMTGLYALVAISFFMSVMFPTIYGIALEGTREDAKFGAAFLVMAIVGGALMPALQGLILDIGGIGYTDVKILGIPEVNFSFVLPLLCFTVVLTYGKMVSKQIRK